MLRRAKTMATLSLLPTSFSLQIPNTLRRFLSLSPHKALRIRPPPFGPRLSTARPLSLSSTVPHTSQVLTSYVDLDPRHLSCSMPGKRLKVAVLVSGGVDSSVALRLLHAAGHSCTAFYLKIWFQEDFENFWSECPWEEDLKYAKAVCNQVDIPLEVVHLTDEYWKYVVSYIIEEYRCGRTPNPDVLCNTRIKFGAFMDAITEMEFDYVASGHYANIVHSFTEHMDKPSVLELSKDMAYTRRREMIALPPASSAPPSASPMPSVPKHFLTLGDTLLWMMRCQLFGLMILGTLLFFRFLEVI